MDLDKYYEEMFAFQEKYDGKRARLVGYPQETTGVFERSEDGLTFIIDHPLPEWTRDFEDSQTGRLNFDQTCEDRFEILPENN